MTSITDPILIRRIAARLGCTAVIARTGDQLQDDREGAGMSADNLPVVRPPQDARNLSRVVRAAVRLEYDPATTKMLTGIADDLDKIADRATTTEEMLARSAERIKKLENTMTVLAIFFHASSNHPGYWGQCEDIECTGYRNVLSVEKQS